MKSKIRTLRGVLLATAAALTPAAMAVAADTEEAVWSFAGGSDGAAPSANLLIDKTGALYGTTASGGGSSGCSATGSSGGSSSTAPAAASYAPKRSATPAAASSSAPPPLAAGCGTVFKLTPPASAGNPVWSETILYNFSAAGDGTQPAGLIADAATGVLYGVTAGGGAKGLGTVFALQPNGSGYTETILYSFQGGTDGTTPNPGLLLTKSGAIYGTTQAGGSGTCSVTTSSSTTPAPCGTVFKLTPPAAGANPVWTETIIHNFGTAAKDGFAPNDNGLVRDSSGNIYGTTAQGGHKSNAGTVYRLSPGSGGKWTETVLYRFTGKSDGATPQGTLAVSTNGQLFGTTLGGGKGFGTVFTLSPPAGGESAWQERTLHAFKSGADGASPKAGLTLMPSGALFGTTSAGGANDAGVAFKLGLSAADGAVEETVLYSFGASNLATHPGSPVIKQAGGVIFGASADGGANGQGEVFELSPQ